MRSAWGDYLWCWAGLALGNLLWARIWGGGDYTQVLENTYFQGVAFLALAGTDWCRGRK